MAVLCLLLGLGTGCTAKQRFSRHLKRADAYFEAGEYEKAKIEYINALRLDQQNGRVFNRVGTIWLEQGAPIQAGPFLFQATKLAPSDYDAWLKLARAYAGVGSIGEAHRIAGTVVQQEPGNGEALLLYADSARTPDDTIGAATALQNFPNKDSLYYHLVAASLNLRQEQTQHAETFYRQAEALDPKSFLPHNGLAALHMVEKDDAGLEKELKIASELAPVRSMERIRYAEFLFSHENKTQAETVVREVTEKAPDFVPAWRLYAQMALSREKPDEALATLDHAFKIDADNPDCRLLEANARMAKGEGGKAIQALERIDKIHPGTPLIKLQLAKAHQAQNDLPAAAGILSETVTAIPNYTEAVLLLAQVNMQLGDYQKVAFGLADFLKRQPGVAEAEIMLAEAYRLLGRGDEAVEIFQAQVKRMPNSAPSFVALGLALRLANRPEDAQKAFESALALAPENTLALDQLIEMDLRRNDAAAALERVRRQMEQVPNSAPLHLSESKIYFAQSDWSKTAAVLTQALEIDPNLMSAYDLLIASDLASGKLPEAIAHLQTLLAKDPGNATGLTLLGQVYERAGEREKARESYEKALAVKPETVQALNNLALVCAEANQLDRAAELARKARALQPNDPLIADTLGWVLYKQGDYQQALTLSDDSASKLPQNPRVQFHAGMANYMMGQMDRAREALNKAVASDVDYVGKDEAQRRLAALSGDAGGPGDSIEDLERFTEQQPNDAVAWVRLAEAYEARQDWSKAGGAYERAAKINPKLLRAAVKLAELYAGPLQKKQAALELAKRARELAPGDPDVAAALGRIVQTAGNFTWANSLLQESARQRPEDSRIQHSYAWAAYSVGKINEARQAMERVQTLATSGPEHDDAQVFLALATVEQNGAPAAVEQAESMLQKDAGYTPALMIRAAAAQQNGDSAAAATIYRSVLDRLPEFAFAQKKLAAIYFADPAKAAAASDLAAKARKTLPDDPELASILGEISLQKKEYARAIQLFQESKRKGALDPRGLYHLAQAYAATKQKAEAIAAINQALGSGLGEPDAADARGKLQELQKP